MGQSYVLPTLFHGKEGTPSFGLSLGVAVVVQILIFTASMLLAGLIASVNPEKFRAKVYSMYCPLAVLMAILPLLWFGYAKFLFKPHIPGASVAHVHSATGS